MEFLPMEQVPARTQLEGSMLVGQQMVDLPVEDGKLMSLGRPYPDGQRMQFDKK